MRTFVALSLLLAPAAAAEAPGAPPVYVETIALCRLAFAERLAGREPAKAAELIAALSTDRRGYAIHVCSAYDQGQKDLIAVATADEGTRL